MVFNLYALEGYTHKEIGELLGITEGTASRNTPGPASSYKLNWSASTLQLAMSANPIDNNSTPKTTGSLEELFRHH
jgi:hypothetical protein